MRRWRRVVFFLILNILVSACTTVLVLQVWGRFNPSQAESPEPLSLLNPTATATRPPQSSATPEVTPTLTLDLYQVQPGDTLGTIAEQYGVSVDLLMRLNGLSDPNALGSGEVLLVPVTPDPFILAPSETPAPGEGVVPTRTPLPFGDDLQVEINAIIGPGVLQDERIVIQLNSETELALEGWRLEDSDGNVYIFPRFELFRGGAVSIFSRAGIDTVLELYWGQTQAVWQPQETAVLRDPEGTIRASFTLP
jgi:LysM repeat protein